MKKTCQKKKKPLDKLRNVCYNCILHYNCLEYAVEANNGVKKIVIPKPYYI